MLEPKLESELRYWKTRADAEGVMYNRHYEALFTTAFALEPAFYQGKRVIDIGCGPRGSLEWAHMASERIGLDPLAEEYLKIGARAHKMQYIAAGSEAIPLPDRYFDIVTCLNALDHVDDLDATIREIKRITKSGGHFLLSTEINHLPTINEPQSLPETIGSFFEPEFRIEYERKVGTPPDHNLHQAVLSGTPPFTEGKPGIFVARMRRI